MVQEPSDYEKARRVVYEPLLLRLDEKERHRAWIYWITCGLGWAGKVNKLVDRLDAIWDGYQGRKGRDCWKLLQVKEKFGGLRFYVQIKATGGEEVDKLKDLCHGEIAKVEKECLKLCEKCGKPGKERRPNGVWVKTLCVKCNKDVKGMKDTVVSWTGLG